MKRAGRYLFDLEGSGSGLNNAVFGVCWPLLPLFVRSVGMARVWELPLWHLWLEVVTLHIRVFAAYCSFKDFEGVCR